MPVFAYRAFTATGRSVGGVVDADSSRGAWQALRARGIWPIDVAPQSTAATGARVPAADRAAAVRQLALLIAAGVPVADALDAAAEAAHPVLAQALTRARAAVREGRPLADALAASPRVFSPLACELVRAGEAAGALGATLGRLATHLERSTAVQARLRAALAYPAIMLGATAAVLVFLLTWVVPQMAALFAETGTPLPLVTRALLWSVGLAGWLWWLVPLAGLAGVMAWRRGDREALRARLDAALLRLPIVGRLVAQAALARVARTLATLLAGGTRLEDALGMAAVAAGNRRIADGVEAARERVQQGDPLASALRASAYVPPLVGRLVATGERSGGLAAAFDHAADALDLETERRLATLTGLIEPALVLLMGAAVLVLVLTILVPILSLDPTVGPTAVR